VSPVSAGQILIGKSVGHGLLLLVVGGVLTWATTLLLGVPSLGHPAYYWLSIGVTIFASVALGFALSIVARTESQAVQLAMLILLTSVFFGGFFLPLNLMFSWVRGVSYALPVTYGAVNLRDVMLRGAAPDWTFVLGPTILGLALNAVALYGLRRQMRRG
jgi:ABC-2 type transport system permease protein